MFNWFRTLDHVFHNDIFLHRQQSHHHIYWLFTLVGWLDTKLILPKYRRANFAKAVMSVSLNAIQKQPLEVFCEKSVLRNLAKSTGKHLCQGLFFNKVGSVVWCFPINFAKFLRTPILWNNSGRLLLAITD